MGEGKYLNLISIKWFNIVEISPIWLTNKKIYIISLKNEGKEVGSWFGWSGRDSYCSVGYYGEGGRKEKI